jgi:hypothetical protein
MCQFVLTIDQADMTLTPARPIAHILRAAADKIETQMTPTETGKVIDPRGSNVVLATWTYGDAPAVGPAQ